MLTEPHPHYILCSLLSPFHPLVFGHITEGKLQTLREVLVHEDSALHRSFSSESPRMPMTCDGCGVPIESRWIMLIHVAVLGKFHHVLIVWVLDVLVHDLLALENPKWHWKTVPRQVSSRRCCWRFHPSLPISQSPRRTACLRTPVMAIWLGENEENPLELGGSYI